ncbi:hypothetical protein JW877_01500, partial [bacterium]|nr:hypothetical protein [bacterium]
MKRGLLVIAIFMFFITVANGREMTMPLPAENLTPIEPYECEEGLPPLNSAGSICYPKPGAFIEIYDSLQIELMLLPGSFQAIYIDVEAGTLGYSPPGPIVDDELIPYIQTAPQFLQRQLYLNLSEMDEFSSRAYTEMLDSAHPLWWDELFYCMANLGYEILMDWYRADLLLENVREMYRADSL